MLRITAGAESQHTQQSSRRCSPREGRSEAAAFAGVCCCYSACRKLETVDDIHHCTLVKCMSVCGVVRLWEPGFASFSWPNKTLGFT
jgi:hypothetical protein